MMMIEWLVRLSLFARRSLVGVSLVATSPPHAEAMIARGQGFAASHGWSDGVDRRQREEDNRASCSCCFAVANRVVGRIVALSSFTVRGVTLHPLTSSSLLT
jgi:hypothetical protein